MIWLPPRKVQPDIRPKISPDCPPSPCHPTDLVLAAVLSVIVYAPVASAWWLGDDPAILQHLLETSLWSNFFVPDVWRAYSPSNFTPVLILSFAIDFKLFGLSPSLYYWHQLICLAVATSLGFYLLCDVLTRRVAALVTVLILLSPPISEIAGALMTRHYLDGMVLSLLAIIFFRFAVTKRLGASAYWVIAALYLAAALAKEIYVLLPILLLAFMAQRSWSEKRKSLTPFVFVLLGYAIWRAYMLGTSGLVTGYGDLLYKTEDETFWETLSTTLSVQMGLGGFWRAIIFMSLGSVGVIALTYRFGLGGFLAVCTSGFAAWAPIFFVWPSLADRYLLLPTIWFLTLFGLGVEQLVRLTERSRLRLSGLTLAFALAITVPAVLSPGVLVDEAGRARASEEGYFTWSWDDSFALVNPAAPPWFHRSLGWLRSKLGDGQTAPLACYDPCWCDLKALRPVWLTSEGELSVGSLDPEQCPEHEHRPMSVRLRFSSDKGVLSWKLAAPGTGRWFAARGPGFFWREIPPSGEIPYVYKKAVGYRFIFSSDEGWRSVTPLLVLDQGKGESDGFLTLTWERR